MNNYTMTILKNEKIANDTYCMQLEYSNSECIKPGQFINIKINGQYLRRPISICD